jgi:CspA family cold shock protein
MIVNNRKTGVVKYFLVDKNYGFITADDGSGDTFVYISNVRKAGLEKLVEGQKISYKVKLDKKRNNYKATKLELLD